jgi:hypothetical protein
VNGTVWCALAVALVGCEPQHAGLADAAPADVDAGAPAVVESAAPGEPSAHMARWDMARNAALQIPCRAIAVDGPVHLDEDGGAAVALEGQVPSEAWVSLAPDARLVVKDPRTTRETSFVGPSRVRVCVGHREESWITSGRFESAIGAGETPGAEEWVVTPLGVVRYLAAKVTVDVHPSDAGVSLGSGVAFLWLPEDVRAGRSSPVVPPRAAGDAGIRDAGAMLAAATAAIDDDGWLRMSEGTLGLSTKRPATPHDTLEAARTVVDRCAGLAKRTRELAAGLLAGPLGSDGGTAKEQMQTRRIARAACSVAALRVDTLAPSAPKAELSARLEAAPLAGGAPPAAPSSLPTSPP